MLGSSADSGPTGDEAFEAFVMFEDMNQDRLDEEQENYQAWNDHMWAKYGGEI